MDLRGLSRIATDLTLTTVKVPARPAARAIGLETTVDRLDGRFRHAVGTATGDERLKADGRVLQAPGYRQPVADGRPPYRRAEARRAAALTAPPYRLEASAVQSSQAPSTDKVAVS